uniref:Secreted protein n=1 Tax=Haemonchus placei TaxID=6290 RepID=A0A0N4WZ84_HAEPC
LTSSRSRAICARNCTFSFSRTSTWCRLAASLCLRTSRERRAESLFFRRLSR